MPIGVDYQLPWSSIGNAYRSSSALGARGGCTPSSPPLPFGDMRRKGLALGLCALQVALGPMAEGGPLEGVERIGARYGQGAELFAMPDALRARVLRVRWPT